MKFLCIECDEAMKLTTTSDSKDGSLNVMFRCPKCTKEIAMLTNSMETQMVKAMDVKIGGRQSSTEPMEKLRSSLVSKKEDYNIPAQETITPAYDEMSSQSSEPKCPFPGMVSQMENQKTASASEVVWTEEAKERMQRIPDFVREMVVKGIEQHAKEKGYKEINEKVMDEVKGNFGM